MKLLKKIGLDTLITLGIIILAIVMLIGANSFPKTAAQFPRLISIFTIIIGVMTFIEIILKKKKGEHHETGLTKEKLIPALIMFGLIVLYFILMRFLGFAIATLIFSPLASKYMGSNRYLLNIGIAVGFILFVYFAFVNFLQVPIPMIPRFL